MHRFIAALLVLSAAASTAHATVLFDNFQAPGDQHSIQRTIFGVGTDADQVANFFTASANALVSSIDVALARGAESIGNDITLTLWNDASGLPGPISLGSVTLSGQAASPPGSVLTFSFLTPAAILAGNTYWVGLGAGANTTLIWYDSSVALIASEPFRTGNGAWSSNSGTPGAFRVNGELAAVPLPASAWLMLSGMLGLWALARRPAKA